LVSVFFVTGYFCFDVFVLREALKPASVSLQCKSNISKSTFSVCVSVLDVLGSWLFHDHFRRLCFGTVCGVWTAHKLTPAKRDVTTVVSDTAKAHEFTLSGNLFFYTRL